MFYTAHILAHYIQDVGSLQSDRVRLVWRPLNHRAAAVHVNVGTTFTVLCSVIKSILTSSFRPAALCSLGWPETAETLDSASGCPESPEREGTGWARTVTSTPKWTSWFPSTLKLTAAAAVMLSLVQCWVSDMFTLQAHVCFHVVLHLSFFVSLGRGLGMFSQLIGPMSSTTSGQISWSIAGPIPAAFTC